MFTQNFGAKNLKYSHKYVTIPLSFAETVRFSSRNVGLKRERNT